MFWFGFSISVGMCYVLVVVLIIYFMVCGYWIGLIGFRLYFFDGIDWGCLLRMGVVMCVFLQVWDGGFDGSIECVDWLVMMLFLIILFVVQILVGMLVLVVLMFGVLMVIGVLFGGVDYVVMFVLCIVLVVMLVLVVIFGILEKIVVWWQVCGQFYE